MLFPWLLLILVPILGSPVPEKRAVRVSSGKVAVELEKGDNVQATPNEIPQQGSGPCKKIILTYDRRRRAARAELRRRKRDEGTQLMEFPKKMKVRIKERKLIRNKLSGMRRMVQDDYDDGMPDLSGMDEMEEEEEDNGELVFFVFDYDEGEQAYGVVDKDILAHAHTDDEEETKS